MTIRSNSHLVTPNYNLWGLADSNKEAVKVEPLTEAQLEPFIALSQTLIDLAAFRLSKSGHCQYYRGTDNNSKHIAWLRFVPKGQEDTYTGEHITFLWSIDNKNLIAMNHFTDDMIGTQRVTHQQALETAMAFIKKHAPDMIQTAQAPQIGTESPENRITLEIPAMVDHAELQWVGPHSEPVKIEGEDKTSTGIKVKFRMPRLGLWMWCIVNDKNEVMTFEREVFWDFDAMQRHTQMWLYNPWLRAQAL